MKPATVPVAIEMGGRYLRPGAVDTFVALCHRYYSEDSDGRASPTWVIREREAMAVQYRGFQLGLLPERRVDKMKAMGRIVVFVFALVASAFGQNRSETGPAAAATGPAFAVSAGYTYIAMPIPSAGHVNLNGLDVGGQVDIASRWGATVDTSYVRASDILGTGHNSYIWSLLAGPVFYPVERRNTRMFVHVLAGAGLVDGAVPVSETYYLHGWVARFSDALGGGFEHSLSGPFAVRLSGDYLRTTFVDAAAVAHVQNNLRATVSVVFRMRERKR